MLDIFISMKFGKVENPEDVDLGDDADDATEEASEEPAAAEEEASEEESQS